MGSRSPPCHHREGSWSTTRALGTHWPKQAYGGDRSGSHQALLAHSMCCHPHSPGPSIPSCGIKTKASLLVQRADGSQHHRKNKHNGDQGPLQAQVGAISWCPD